MKTFTKYALFCCLIIFFSCVSDPVDLGSPSGEDPSPVPVDFTENFGSSTTATFFGRIVDENKEPIEGAIIRIGNSSTTTDTFGVFSINNADAFERYVYITAQKTGYLNGSRSLAPSQTETNFVEIMLLKEEVVATINSSQNTTVDFDNGSSVTFDGSFSRQDGTPYTGSVNVIAKHLNPDDEDMPLMMPGMLFAQNASGDAVALETFGMLAIELRSPSGQQLQLADNSTAQISMPLPSSVSNAPATIPLWFFDDEVGYWKEEGQASLQGNKYIGAVSHFTFWNYDFPYPPIFLCITLQDEDGNTLPYTELDLYSNLLNSTGTYGYTNSAGVECGLVPKDEELTVTVMGSVCAEDVFTTTIGPFSVDSNITITVSNSEQITFTGNFLTCDSSNITNGYLQLAIDGTSEIIPVNDGVINYTINTCDATSYTITGIDVENNQATDVITGSIGGETTIDLGSFSACIAFQDSDNDSIFDAYEDVNGDNNLDNDDTDDDGVPNYLDADDDNDGINTIDEDYDGDNNPRNDDTDGDGTPNYLDAIDVVVFSSEIGSDGCNPVSFDLNILNEFYNDTNTTYSFYSNESDAQSESNSLDTSSAFTISYADAVTGLDPNNILEQKLYVRALSIITGQFAIVEIYLYLNVEDSDQDGLTDCEELTGVDYPFNNSVPSGTSDPNDPNDPGSQTNPTGEVLQACSSDDFALFDLSSMDSIYLGGNNPDDYTITYHSSPADALNGINQLPVLYQNIINPQVIYVRVFELATGNYVVEELTLEVVPPPVIPEDLSITECDGDGDGFATFDLTSVEADIMALNSNIEISFLDPSNNPIVNPQDYTEISSFVLVEIIDVINGCITIAVLDLNVDSSC